MQFCINKTFKQNGGHESWKRAWQHLCVLCAVKLEDKVSRINVRDRNSFSIEDELKNLPINVISKKKVLTGQTRVRLISSWYGGAKSDFSLSFYGFTLTSI